MSDRTVLLFQSLAGQLEENKELRTLINTIIYSNEPVKYYVGSPAKEAVVHGFLSVAKDGSLGIANRVFETWLHTYLSAYSKNP
jgi:hypothetical protein